MERAMGAKAENLGLDLNSPGGRGVALRLLESRWRGWIVVSLI